MDAVLIAPVRIVAGPAKPTKSLKLLIVDDNRDTADGCLRVSKLSGHAAHVAYTEEEGRRLLASPPVGIDNWDAIVADWWLQPDLPGGGGRLIAWSRAIGLNIPCALFTGYPTEEFRVVGSVLEQLGRVWIVHKPIEFDIILAGLQEMVDNRSPVALVPCLPTHNGGKKA